MKNSFLFVLLSLFGISLNSIGYSETDAIGSNSNPTIPRGEAICEIAYFEFYVNTVPMNLIGKGRIAISEEKKDRKNQRILYGITSEDLNSLFQKRNLKDSPVELSADLSSPSIDFAPNCYLRARNSVKHPEYAVWTVTSFVQHKIYKGIVDEGSPQDFGLGDRRRYVADKNIFSCEVQLVDLEGAGFGPRYYGPARSTEECKSYSVDTIRNAFQKLEPLVNARWRLDDGPMYFDSKGEVSLLDAGIDPSLWQARLQNKE